MGVALEAHATDARATLWTRAGVTGGENEGGGEDGTHGVSRDCKS